MSAALLTLRACSLFLTKLRAFSPISYKTSDSSTQFFTTLSSATVLPLNTKRRERNDARGYFLPLCADDNGVLDILARLAVDGEYGINDLVCVVVVEEVVIRSLVYIAVGDKGAIAHLGLVAVDTKDTVEEN